MPSIEPLLRVAVPSPLRRSFDYLPPHGLSAEDLPVGVRLLVPFGRQQLVGVLLAVVTSTEVSHDKLKRVKKCIDSQPVLPRDLLKLLQWASQYYQHPIGEVFSTALPALLRTDQAACVQGKKVWCLTQAGRELELLALKRAPRQQALMQQLHGKSKWDVHALSVVSDNWRPAMARLVEQGWVEVTEETVLPLVQSEVCIPHTLRSEERRVGKECRL